MPSSRRWHGQRRVLHTNAAGLFIAEDVGVEVTDAVGCEEGGDEAKRPHDQYDDVV